MRYWSGQLSELDRVEIVIPFYSQSILNISIYTEPYYSHSGVHFVQDYLESSKINTYIA